MYLWFKCQIEILLILPCHPDVVAIQHTAQMIPGLRSELQFFNPP